MRALALCFITLAGMCVGSFCNVLIFRIPKGEDFVRTRSHCMSCGHTLRWYELIPVVSFVLQRGRCRACGAKLSPQYPAVEALNGAAWLLCCLLFWEEPVRAALYCALSSVLTVIAVIDARTMEIPNGLTIAVAVLGLVQLAADYPHWYSYLIGAACVSVPLLLLWLASGGRLIGLGDVKLLAAAGLLLGWQRILPALAVGSLIGCVHHLIRMARGAGHMLAFGPYLSAGIWLAALFGERAIAAYLGLFGL